MSRFRLRASSAARAIAALGLVGIAASCSGDGTGPAVPDNEVRVSDNRFTPSTRTVPAGTTVTFRWASGAGSHNVTFDDGPASPNQSSGTYQRTFNAAGSFPYECTIHGASMSGTITVQ